uniref:Uncharacterized protein n=1 Tax=Strix occidentalis caurina TaxID=311401 RepID=A0A8D0F5T6_STROC
MYWAASEWLSCPWIIPSSLCGGARVSGCPSLPCHPVTLSPRPRLVPPLLGLSPCPHSPGSPARRRAVASRPGPPCCQPRAAAPPSPPPCSGDTPVTRCHSGDTPLSPPPPPPRGGSSPTVSPGTREGWWRGHGDTMGGDTRTPWEGTWGPQGRGH